MSLLNKKEKRKENNDPLIRLMTPTIAGILVCTFCLVSMTWAWFSASVDTPAQTLQSATRSTLVTVSEVSQNADAGDNDEPQSVTPSGNENNPSAASLTENSEINEEIEVIASEPHTWELPSNGSYNVKLEGGGNATKGYCTIALSYTTDQGTTETKTYRTDAFENGEKFEFTCNTGSMTVYDNLTATEWTNSIETTPPASLTIASHWGTPPVETTPQIMRMSARNTAEEGIMLLSDGDVIGLAPIPCPEAKAETEVELEGFEVQESAEISAEEDYKVSLTLKEGYEMPSEVVVNIGGKDYVVSTGGAEASEDAPYYDAASGVLTVPSSLLSDGTKVSVKATATQIPVEEETEEEKTEEATEETTEEQAEEPTDSNETEEDKAADTSSDNTVVADNPNKKEDDDEKDSDKPKKMPAGGGGNDDDNDEADNSSEDSSNENASSSPEDASEETEDEKADVKLNLSQLTINLEETKIPTNADLVLTLSAKEDMELPEQIVITLDKTIRDENVEDEEIEEDKTEYIINTDGKDNPEGFEFDAESGELTISSELLEGVREITIADTEENEADEDEDKATITFEVKNITFDFTDDEIATDEDVVITFTAGKGYELPETIIITIDGEEYIVYTSAEDSDKNPEGITFDIETGTLTISKDLLSDAEAITITAEGVKKEDEKAEDKEENSDTDKKDESDDKDTGDKKNETEGGEATDKDTESGTDAPDAEDKTENGGGTDAPGGENTETTDPDNTTEGEDNGEGNGKDNGKDNGEDGNETETQEPGTEPTTPAMPTEPTTPAEPSEPVVTPEIPSTSESATGGSDGDDNGKTGSVDSSLAESSNSGKDSAESNASSESTTTSSEE